MKKIIVLAMCFVFLAGVSHADTDTQGDRFVDNFIDNLALTAVVIVVVVAVVIVVLVKVAQSDNEADESAQYQGAVTSSMHAHHSTEVARIISDSPTALRDALITTRLTSLQ